MFGLSMVGYFYELQVSLSPYIFTKEFLLPKKLKGNAESCLELRDFVCVAHEIKGAASSERAYLKAPD